MIKYRNGVNNENNIKILIDNKILQNQDNKDNKLFLHQQKIGATHSTSSSFGTDSKARRGIMPHSELCRSQISYVKASLRDAKSTRRAVNVDMRLHHTTHNQFNRLVFNLTPRLWEFTANLPITVASHESYSNAQSKFLEWSAQIQPHRCWLGKGRARGKWKTKGGHRTPIKPGCVMVLRQRHLEYDVWMQLEKAQLEFTLLPTSMERYPYQGDCQLTQGAQLGSWGDWQ